MKAANVPHPSGRSPVQRLRHGAVLVFGVQAGGLLLGYGAQVLLGRWLGAAGYGAYNLVYAWVATAGTLLGLGLPGAVLRFLPACRAEGDLAGLRGLVQYPIRLLLTLSVGIAGMATLILWWGPPFAHRSVWLWGVWALPALTLAPVQSEILRVFGRMGWAFAPLHALRPLLMMVGAGGWLLVAGTLASHEAMMLLCLVLTSFLLLRAVVIGQTLPPETRTVPPRHDVRRWLRVALPLLLATAFTLLGGQADVLVLGFFHPTDAVGLYFASTRVATVVRLPLQAVSAVVAPQIAATFAQSGAVALQPILRRTMPWVLGPSVLGAGLLLLLAAPLLSLFGPAFTAGTGLLRLLVVGYLVDAVTGPVAYLLTLTGHQDDNTRIYGYAALVNVLLCLLLIPWLGVTGAALAHTTTLLVRNTWLYVRVWQRLGVRVLPGLPPSAGRAHP